MNPPPEWFQARNGAGAECMTARCTPAERMLHTDTTLLVASQRLF